MTDRRARLTGSSAAGSSSQGSRSGSRSAPIQFLFIHHHRGVVATLVGVGPTRGPLLRPNWSQVAARDVGARPQRRCRPGGHWCHKYWAAHLTNGRVCANFHVVENSLDAACRATLFPGFLELSSRVRCGRGGLGKIVAFSQPRIPLVTAFSHSRRTSKRRFETANGSRQDAFKRAPGAQSRGGIFRPSRLPAWHADRWRILGATVMTVSPYVEYV